MYHSLCLPCLNLSRPLSFLNKLSKGYVGTVVLVLTNLQHHVSALQQVPTRSYKHFSMARRSCLAASPASSAAAYLRPTPRRPSVMSKAPTHTAVPATMSTSRNTPAAATLSPLPSSSPRSPLSSRPARPPNSRRCRRWHRSRLRQLPASSRPRRTADSRQRRLSIRSPAFLSRSSRRSRARRPTARCWRGRARATARCAASC